jgi:ABC-type bacteriocin/lantibiotic exporter with double-glycine peptidase domain
VPNILLPIPHCTQRSNGDCLAACAKMALDYLGVSADYDHLLRLLGVNINDPAFEQSPQRVSHADFELAWMAFDYRYGVVWCS